MASALLSLHANTGAKIRKIDRNALLPFEILEAVFL